MSAFANYPIRYTRSQRRGIALFVLLFILLQGGFLLLDRQNREYEEPHLPEQLTAAMNSETGENSAEEPPFGDIYVNELDLDGWKSLGFSDKQAATIVKYRYSLGGYFETTEQIRACYVISEKKYRELEPHLRIHIPAQYKTEPNIFSRNEYRQPKIHYAKFNPNEFTESDWQKIGFSEKQAGVILKYKRSLGGSFSTLEEIEACFVISPEKFREMKPYIDMKTESAYSEDSKPNHTEETQIAEADKFNPNDLNEEEWVSKGFSEKQVRTILNYKTSLGGHFSDAETLKRCYVISEKKFSELEPFLIFD